MNYPHMHDLARLSREDYSDVHSLDSISRGPRTRFEGGYPAQGTPEWWALRQRYEELLMAKIRRDRAGSPIRTQHDRDREYEAAKWASLGNEDADREYQSHAHQPGRPDWLGLHARLAGPGG